MTEANLFILTGIPHLPRVTLAMKRRLASLFLLLVLGGGAFAGVPMSFGESLCSMGGMMDMECCKAMRLLQGRTKFTAEEELLCALSCAQNGTTLPASSVRMTPPTLIVHAAAPAVAPTLPVLHPFSRATVQAHSPPGSPPTYLRNLALLI